METNKFINSIENERHKIFAREYWNLLTSTM